MAVEKFFGFEGFLHCGRIVVLSQHERSFIHLMIAAHRFKSSEYIPTRGGGAGDQVVGIRAIVDDVWPLAQAEGDGW